jgi:restriction endonuclease Mrr
MIPEFLEFQKAKNESIGEAESVGATERLDPQENIEVGYRRIRKELSAELLARIKACSPGRVETRFRAGHRETR